MRFLLTISCVLNILCIILIVYLKTRLKYYLKDRFTAAYNYFFLETKFNAYLKPENRFLFIDIDNFKKQNLLLGYETADQLLSLFVDKLKLHLPSKTIIIRYKLGDEFVLILQNESEASFKNIIANLRKERSAFVFNIYENLIQLDFTMSYTNYEDGDTPSTVLTRLVNNNLLLKVDGK